MALTPNETQQKVTIANGLNLAPLPKPLFQLRHSVALCGI
jgi:hypothetical protein